MDLRDTWPVMTEVVGGVDVGQGSRLRLYITTWAVNNAANDRDARSTGSRHNDSLLVRVIYDTAPRSPCSISRVPGPRIDEEPP